LFGKRCAKRGYETLFKWGYENNFRYSYNETNAAAKYSFPLLKWASQMNIPICDEALTHAAVGGNIETMAWLVDEGHCEWRSNVLDYIPDDPKILDWVESRQYRLWEYMISVRAFVRRGRLKLIKWYYKKKKKSNESGMLLLTETELTILTNVFVDACATGFLHIAEWTMRSLTKTTALSLPHCDLPWCSTLMPAFKEGLREAAIFGHVHILDWIWNQIPHTLVDPYSKDGKKIMSWATMSKSRNSKSIIWLAEHGWSFNSGDISRIDHVSPELLLWWVNNNEGANWTDVSMGQLARYGDIEFLQTALKNGCQRQPCDMKTRLRSSDCTLEFLKWANENGYPMRIKLYTNNIPILNYLVDCGCHVPKEYERIFFRSMGESFDKLTWLISHDVSVPKYMIYCSLAVVTPQEVEKFCTLFPGTSVFEPELFHAAACNNNSSLLKWINQHDNYNDIFRDKVKHYDNMDFINAMCNTWECGWIYCIKTFERARSTRYYYSYHALYCSESKEDLEILRKCAVSLEFEDWQVKELIGEHKWRSIRWLIRQGYKWNPNIYEELQKYHEDPSLLQWVDENWKKEN